jgi:hypothetical protein
MAGLAMVRLWLGNVHVRSDAAPGLTDALDVIAKEFPTDG